MNCEMARRLVDEFMHDELNHRDRIRMEEHLAKCPRCAMELRKQPALERDVRRALAASVQPLYVPADVSARIVRASEQTLHRAGRAHRTAFTARVTSAVLVLLLVAVGFLALLGRIPVPSSLKPVSLFPTRSLPSAEPELDAVFGDGKPIPEMASPTLSQLGANLLIEPRDMRASEPFTITVWVQSDLPEPMEAIDLDLDISGPTGAYHFGLSFNGPLPAEGTAVFRVTPDLLADTCAERYLMSPTDLFGAPGTYTIRATLFSPVVVSD